MAKKTHRMSRASQVAFAKSWVEGQGFEAQTIDIESLIDGSLSYEENIKNLKSHLKMGGRSKKKATRTMTASECDVSIGNYHAGFNHGEVDRACECGDPDACDELEKDADKPIATEKEHAVLKADAAKLYKAISKKSTDCYAIYGLGTHDPTYGEDFEVLYKKYRKLGIPSGYGSGMIDPSVIEIKKHVASYNDIKKYSFKWHESKDALARLEKLDKLFDNYNSDLKNLEKKYKSASKKDAKLSQTTTSLTTVKEWKSCGVDIRKYSASDRKTFENAYASVSRYISSGEYDVLDKMKTRVPLKTVDGVKYFGYWEYTVPEPVHKAILCAGQNLSKRFKKMKQSAPKPEKFVYDPYGFAEEPKKPAPKPVSPPAPPKVVKPKPVPKKVVKKPTPKKVVEPKVVKKPIPKKAVKKPIEKVVKAKPKKPVKKAKATLKGTKLTAKQTKHLKDFGYFNITRSGKKHRITPSRVKKGIIQR